MSIYTKYEVREDQVYFSNEDGDAIVMPFGEENTNQLIAEIDSGVSNESEAEESEEETPAEEETTEETQEEEETETESLSEETPAEEGAE